MDKQQFFAVLEQLNKSAAGVREQTAALNQVVQELKEKVCFSTAGMMAMEELPKLVEKTDALLKDIRETTSQYQHDAGLTSGETNVDTKQ